MACDVEVEDEVWRCGEGGAAGSGGREGGGGGEGWLHHSSRWRAYRSWQREMEMEREREREREAEVKRELPGVEMGVGGGGCEGGSACEVEEERVVSGWRDV